MKALFKISRVVLTLVLFTACSVDQPENSASKFDWPQWLGVERNGRSAETDLLKTWPEGGPQELWRVEVGGGYSGLSISQGRLYTMVCDSTDEYVLCLDAESGNELWRVRSDSAYVDRFDNGNGPRSTPTVDVNGRFVFALGAHGALGAYAKDSGELVWRKNLKTDFNSPGPAGDGGFASSPLIEGDMLLVETGGAANNSFAAFDKNTGGLLWQTASDSAGFASPVAITVHGERQIVFFSSESMTALAAETGEIRWRLPWKTPYNISTNAPIFIPPDRMLVSSINDMGSALIRLEKSGDDFSVNEIWRSNKVLNSYATPILHDGYLYGFQNTFLSCVALDSGEEQWRQRGFSYGTLAYADSHLVVLGEKGKLAFVEAVPDAYNEKAAVEVLGNRCYTPPSIANGKLYLRDESTILCLLLK